MAGRERVTSTAITLMVPVGPTDNRRHVVSARGRRFVDSHEYRTWKAHACADVRSQLPAGWKPIHPTEDHQCPYHVKVFLPSRRVDAANYDKGLRDVLTTAGVWDDDRWAMPQFERAEVFPKDPWIIVTIPLTPEREASFWPDLPDPHF